MILVTIPKKQITLPVCPKYDSRLNKLRQVRGLVVARLLLWRGGVTLPPPILFAEVFYAICRSSPEALQALMCLQDQNKNPR